MAKQNSFDIEKANLDEACQALRSFTLARPGATRKSGLQAVERVNAVCERMSSLFYRGPNALRLASILHSVRGQILAAEARLNLMARQVAKAREAS